jgi:hypothetical protein
MVWHLRGAQVIVVTLNNIVQYRLMARTATSRHRVVSPSDRDTPDGGMYCMEDLAIFVFNQLYLFWRPMRPSVYHEAHIHQ